MGAVRFVQTELGSTNSLSLHVWSLEVKLHMLWAQNLVPSCRKGRSIRAHCDWMRLTCWTTPCICGRGPTSCPSARRSVHVEKAGQWQAAVRAVHNQMQRHQCMRETALPQSSITQSVSIAACARGAVREHALWRFTVWV